MNAAELVEAVRIDHYPVQWNAGPSCPTCDDRYPCPPAIAADRIEKIRRLWDDLDACDLNDFAAAVGRLIEEGS